jgi:hypothetical protein
MCTSSRLQQKKSFNNCSNSCPMYSAQTIVLALLLQLQPQLHQHCMSVQDANAILAQLLLL